MILLLRLGALALNAAAVGGAFWLTGTPWYLAAPLPPLLWWACARAPEGRPAPAELLGEAEATARLLGAPGPRWVRCVHGWTAASVRSGRGYGLLVGTDVERVHLRSLLAHEIAHFAEGDLAWEPFTDGPARLLLPLLRRIPPLVLPFFPFLLLGVPLARTTELRADAVAARAVPSYPAALQAMAVRTGRVDSLLYPSLEARLKLSARHSLEEVRTS